LFDRIKYSLSKSQCAALHDIAADCQRHWLQILC